MRGRASVLWVGACFAMLLPMCGFAADLPQKVGSDLIVTVSKSTDNSGLLDTPQLSNIALTAPYLHDGTARSLEEIWIVFNPDDKHGRTNNLTKDELNDLVEYLRTR